MSTLEEAAERIGIWWEGHSEGARKQLSKYVLNALREATSETRAEVERLKARVEELSRQANQLELEAGKAQDALAAVDRELHPTPEERDRIETIRRMNRRLGDQCREIALLEAELAKVWEPKRGRR